MIALTIISILAGCSAASGIFYFILYLKIRLTDRGHPDEPRFNPSQLQTMQEKEDRYLSRHGASLLIFFLLGIAILAIIAYK